MTANTGDEREREGAAHSEQRKGRRPTDTFAARLVLSRHLAGHLSIREAAEMCGLGRGAWTNWERGARPSAGEYDMVDVCQLVADKLDIDREWLLFGGPLLPARGRPVRKASDITGTYRRLPVRPHDTRPSGRPRKVVAAPPTSPAQPTRPRRVIDRSQPVAV
jgi:transcriptional regulator with XRE-family HTH domain